MTATKEPLITPASYLGALILAALGASALASFGSIWCGIIPLLAVALYTLVRGLRLGGRHLCRHTGLALGLASTAALVGRLTVGDTTLTLITLAGLVIGILMVGVDELLK